MREIIKYINLLLSLGLIVPVFLLVKRFYYQTVEKEIAMVRRFFLIVYSFILVLTTLTFIFYAIGSIGFIDGRIIHDISPYRTSLFIIAFWFITISYYKVSK